MFMLFWGIHHKLLFALFMIIDCLMIYLIFNFTMTNVLADPLDKEDFENALNTAPRGLDIDSPAFKLGTFDGNEARVLRRNDDPNDRSGVLNVTSNTNQIGAIWSNFAADNYFDMDKTQTLSMWLYFGRPFGKDPLEVGDGMSFVLQNDPREYGAISTYDGKPAVGETLGVWGADFDNILHDGSFVTSKDIAKTAIQNSWALEFDTFINQLKMYTQINGKGVSFDMDKQGQHMGNSYPGDPSTYRPENSADVGSNGQRKQYFVLNHGEGFQFMKLTNHDWNHMTVKWDPSTKELTYWLYDKNLDGTSVGTIYTKTIKLNLDEFNFKTSDHRLHWGFTGTTGQFTENNLIVFESIPSFINAESHVTIDNLTSNKPVNAGDSVRPGDALDFNYQLSYTSGTKDWKDILANLNLPKQVTFSSGDIIYDDGLEPEHINASELNNGNLQHVLKESLNSTHPNAKIILHTIVNSVKTDTFVGKQHASFKSDNFIIDDDTPNFKIAVDSLMISTDPSGTITYPNMDTISDNVLIDGSVWYGAGYGINYNNITVDSSLNDEQNDTIKCTQKDIQTAGFNLNIPKDKLHKGTNILKVQAVSTVTNNGVTVVLKSKELQIDIEVGGSLKFGDVSKNVAFKSVNEGYNNQIVPRQDGWKVEVIDGRSSESSWTLQAEASRLINPDSKEELNGEMVYKDNSGKLLTLTNPTNIYTNTKDTDSSQTIDVVKSWNNNVGIFLRLNHSNSSGQYSGKITWSLLDGIQNV